MNRIHLFLALAGLGAAAFVACVNAGIVCSPPDTACAPNVCVDLNTDPNHCGSCDHACATGQSCVAFPDAGPTCVCPNGVSPADGGICMLTCGDGGACSQ